MMYQLDEIKLRGMDKHDEYLIYTYGDYMQLPSDDSRKDILKYSNFMVIKLRKIRRENNEYCYIRCGRIYRN